MHGRLESSQRPLGLANDREPDHSTLLILVEGEAAALEHVRELAAKLPSVIAFVVRKEPADTHRPIVAYLIASGAVFGGAPVDGDLIRPGYLYLLDEDTALRRCGGKFVINHAYERSSLTANKTGGACFERLTLRQREVLQMVVAGDASKRIAASLSISQRTVENHRAAIMRRLGARTLADLVRITVSR